MRARDITEHVPEKRSRMKDKGSMCGNRGLVEGE